LLAYRNIYPWWEWFPAFEVEITNLTINPGDMVTMLICTSQAAGSTTATAYFTNAKLMRPQRLPSNGEAAFGLH
jgi:Peptidase A4 family